MTAPGDSTPSAVDACFEGDPELLAAAEARRRIDAMVSPLDDAQAVSIKDSLGRVLAVDLDAPMDVPGHTNSAVDGYAICGADIAPRGETRFEVIGTAMAGAPFTSTVSQQQCVRIMTGAAMPAGTDTVVMQENVTRDGDSAQIETGHRVGQNVRMAGEDLKRGARMLCAGRRLMPCDLGLLASVGIDRVQVIRRPRVSYFSTGDELRCIGEPLTDGQIYDSNRYTLHGMLARLGVTITDLGVVADRRDAVREALMHAADTSDLVITSGGVSTGEADHVKHVLSEIGQIGFWRIAIRPGRPLAFGRIGDALFFGLPGNPVAVMVTFYQFVQPALRALEAEANPAPTPMLEARCVHALRKKPGRIEYYRAIVYRNEHGALEVCPTGKTGSGLLHTMSDANCFIVLDEDSESLAAGATVPVQPFHGLV